VERTCTPINNMMVKASDGLRRSPIANPVAETAEMGGRRHVTNEHSQSKHIGRITRITREVLDRSGILV